MSSSNDLEIEWLKNEIIPKILKNQKLIENFNEKDIEHFKIHDVKIQVIGAQEAFMLTSCYRASIEYEFKGAKNKLNLFVKKTPQLPQEIFDGVSFKALFSNEILAYEKLIPALEEFSKINLNVAKFYYADLQSNFATVITEDFTTKQWTVTKDKVNISLEHILIGVKYLAQFHGIGFALRHLNPELFEKLTKDLLESRYANDEIHPEWAIILRESLKRSIIASRKYDPEVTEEFLQNFATLMGDNYIYGKERVQPREPLITLCHGDYLRNNVAYKYDASGKPVDVMMFDLQTLRVSSPMVDLNVFLSLSTFAGVRHTHFKEIFDAYCGQLKETYEHFVKEDIPEYLSHDSLLKEYIKFLPYSIGICTTFLRNLVEPKELSAQERFMLQRTEEEVINDTWTRGGEVVDRELAHQIKELYELSANNNVNVFKGF